MFYEMTGFAPPDPGPDDGVPDAPDLSRSALFLDFDGTLVDLAETPDGVHTADGLGASLMALRERLGGALCIVTGRAIEAIGRHLPGYEGDVIAGHGVERRIAGVFEQHPFVGSAEVERLQGVVRSFAELDPAFLVETKPAGVVLHFRRNPDLHSEAYRFMESISGHFPEFRIQPAKMAVEMKPADVGKVRAVKWLMARPPYAERRPYYFGDDATDEPAMEWVVQVGGCAVKVGEGETHANYRFGGVQDVHEVLRRWARQDDGSLWQTA